MAKVRRNIVHIDEEKCDGCGKCIIACPEGAIQIIDGKARLVNEAHCDGLGACLGECPQGAILIEEREAEAFDEEAAHKTQQGAACFPGPQASRPFACPGTSVQDLQKNAAPPSEPSTAGKSQSRLRNWPVQINLVPPFAPFLKNAHLLICADCVPFALPNLHADFLSGRVVLNGCPKFDDIDAYREKLTAIFEMAKPASITILRMEVPCCGGIAFFTKQARDAAAPHLPIDIYTVEIESGEVTKETIRAADSSDS